jgi:hypothetical protein
MASEVRDDIPAQLSEGEYVVPADVVRYLGVKHFEDLRNQAKSGLQSMEANGRIGGEPVPAGGPQAPTPYMAQGGDLTPDEMGEIMRMAQGGMIPSDPYQQQQAQYTQPVVQGLQVGGQPSPYNPYRPTGGFSWEQDSPQTTLPTTPQLPVIENEATCAARGLVYNPNTRMCESPQVAPTVTTTPVRSSDDGPSGSPPPETKPWYENTDWSTEGAEGSVERYFGKGAKVGSAVGSVIGGAFGGVSGATVGAYGVQVSNLALARAEVEIRKAMGDDAGAKALEAAIENQLKASVGLGTADQVINDIFGSDGDLSKIQILKDAGINVDSSLRDNDLSDFLKNLNRADRNKLQKFTGFKSEKPVVQKPKKEDEKETPPSSTSPTMTTAPRRSSDNSRDPGPSGAEVARAAAARSVARSEGVSAPTSGGARSVSAPKSETRGTGNRETYASKVQRGGGFNKGGLASRPKKKK